MDSAIIIYMTRRAPFASYPFKDPERYVLYCSRTLAVDPDQCLEEVHIFGALYSARKFLEIVLDEDDFVMVSAERLRTETGITIRCEQLQAILDHEYAQDEYYWDLPEPYSTYARRFRKLQRVADVSVEIEKRERKARTPRASRAGLQSIGEIAEALDMEPREARQILRRTKTPKPDCGWAWSYEDADKIKELLNANR